MAEEKVKIGDLPAASSLGNADVFPVVQAGVTKKGRVDQLPIPTTVVKTTGDQTIEGVKTFEDSPIVPAATAAGNPVRKQEFDTADAANVKRTGNQNIDGVKTFTSPPVVPDATAAQHAITKNTFDKTIPFTSPEIFGALGDGVTDDSAAINSALSFLNGLGGGELRLKGTYLYSRPLIAGANTVIVGTGKAKLKRINEVKTTISANINTGSSSVTVASVAGFSVGMAIRIFKSSYNDSNYNTNQLTITDISGSTITFSGAVSQSFSTGDFLITASKGLQLADGCKVRCVVFDGNKANNTSFNRWDVHGECFGANSSASYSVEECSFINSAADAVITYGKKVRVVGCRFMDINGNAIHFSDTDSCLVDSNFFENTNIGDVSKIGHVGGAISFSDVNKNVIIVNNVIVNGLWAVGFTYGSTSSANHFNGVIKDNVIRNCRTGAIDLKSTTAGVRFDDVTIVGNKIYNSVIIEITSTASTVAKRKVVIKDNTIFNGKILVGYVEDVEISDNKIFNDVNTPESSLVADDTTSVCIQVSTTNCNKIVIDRNHIYGGRYGIYVAGTGATTGQFSIRNNYVFKSYECGIRIFSSGAIYQWAVTGNYVGNETTALSTWDGISVVANAIIAFNFVFAQAGRSCVFINSNGGRVYKNQLYATTTSIYAVSGFGGTTGSDVVDNIINCPVRVGNISPSSNLVKGNAYVGVTNKGSATLVAGSATVAFANIDSASQVFISKTAAGGTEGHVRVTVNAGVGFTLTSSSGTDTSTFTWLII